jgi:chemotaxis protein CheC
MVELNVDVRDALAEVFNIGIGQAASVLSELVHDEILLTVPELGILKRADFIAMAADQWDGRTSIIHQSFDGPFHGDALLIFPVQESLELVRALLAEAGPVEAMTDLERDALLEVGNILLNACLSCIADLLDHEIDNSLPNYVEGEPAAVVSSMVSEAEWCIIFLRIDFSIQRHNMGGNVVFVLDVPAADAFGRAAASLVERYRMES